MSNAGRRTSIACFVLVAAAAISAQQPARDSASQSEGAKPATVRGRVVLDNGAPLARAFVTFPNSSMRGVTTDDDGRYELSGLTPGKLTLVASKLGYVPASYSFRLPAEYRREIDLAPGEVLANVDFVFTNGGVIVIRALNPRGDPTPGVSVSAVRFRYHASGRDWLRAAGVTNDLGEARIFGLPAGDYYVGGNGHYFPGTLFFSQAQTVAVMPGQETTVVMLPGPSSAAVNVTGTVQGADGTPFPQVPLIVSGLAGGGETHSHFTPVQRGRDGTLTIRQLQRGEYVLQVNPSAELPPDEMQYVWLPFEVNGEAVSLAANATRGGAMRGRVVSDTGEPLTGLSPGSLKLVMTATTYAANDRQPEVVVRNDWTFSADTVINSRVLRLQSPVGGWYMKAVMLKGRDITDTPIEFINGNAVEGAELVLTRQPSTVTGAIEGTPTLRHAVIIYGDDPAQWALDSRRIALGRVDGNGRFSIRGLPPGNYLAVAVNDLDTGEERDPTLLQRLRNQAVTFSLVDGGDSVSLNLKTAR